MRSHQIFTVNLPNVPVKAEPREMENCTVGPEKRTTWEWNSPVLRLRRVVDKDESSTIYDPAQLCTFGPCHLGPKV